MPKLLPNLPIEDLTPENDYLGIIDKGEIIKTFLQSNKEEFSEIKMFSLYGEWGSGKSTLMKYLQKELKEDFNTFFFEAWEFESDANLSLSLLEFLTTKSQDSTEEAFSEIVHVAAKLFKGFSKSMRITFPGLSIDGSKIVETLEEEPDETFLQLKDKFKKEFDRWETYVTKGERPKYNLVFIDDLDRCEPENVLNLLSALKLFFTYGEKTIFFCGVDKKAVNEAVRTKYGKVVKANEYLEKVFDISFAMPQDKDIRKLIGLYFGQERISEIITDSWCLYITKFFVALSFSNPRRIKKVLNKYAIIQKIKLNNKLTERYKRHVPNIYTQYNGNILETILVLYIIILQEFYQDKYEKLFDLKHKEYIAVKAMKKRVNSISSNNYQSYLSTINHYLNNQIVNLEIKSVDFYKGGNYDDIVFSMLPDALIEIQSNDFSKGGFETMKFSEITIEHKFLQFLLQNHAIFKEKDSCSQITLLELKRMVRNIL